MSPYFILVISWIIYFALHSALAMEQWKKRFDSKKYRIVYSLISVIGLLILLTINGSIESSVFFDSAGFIKYLSLMLATFGVMVIQLAFKQYSLKAFLGFAQEKSELKEEGILKYIRHPIYSGIILITIGFFLFIPTLPSLISCVCILLYLPIGIYLEERKLINYYGDVYLDYKKRVPSLIPRLI